MVYKRKDLEFLKVFQTCSSGGGALSDHLNIVTDKEKQIVYFSLLDDNVSLIQELPFNEGEDFEVSYSLSQFISMMSFCKDADDIVIEKDKIKFGNNSEYNFESLMFNKDEFTNILDMSIEGEDIELKDLEKIDKISFSIGIEPELACIAFQDNHFITYKSNAVSTAKILSYIKSNNNLEENFYLPQVFYKLYSIYKFKDITIKKLSERFMYMNINNMKIYMTVGDYSIPYIFDDGLKDKLNPVDQVIVNKEEFKTALSRIKVLNQKTLYNRVFINFNDEGIKIEIKDDFKGYENISATVDNNIKNFYIICSTVALFEILNSIPTDQVMINLTNEKGLATIKITDKDNICNHILTLTKKYEE